MKVVGLKESIAIRGDARIFHNELEEKTSHLPEKNLNGTKVGVGYIARTRKVFFTINGREVY